MSEHALESLVAYCLKSGRLESSAKASELLALAAKHKLKPMVWRRLLDEEPSWLLSALRTEAERGLASIERENAGLVQELATILSTFSDANVCVLPIKGVMLAQLLHDDIRLRQCADIDLLVDRSDVDRAITLLVSRGYQCQTKADSLSREFHLVNANDGLWIDLHWNIVGYEIPFPLKFNELWATRQVVPLTGCGVPTVGPEWLFVFTAVYLVKEFPYVELLYVVDAAGLVRRFPGLDWIDVRDIADRTGTRRICTIALLLVARLSAVRPPEEAWIRFPPDRKSIAAAARVVAAISSSSATGRIKYFHRMLGIARHAGLRERLSDSVLSISTIAPFLLFPDREDAAKPGGRPSFVRRARRAPQVVARLIHVAATPRLEAWHRHNFERRLRTEHFTPRPCEDVSLHFVDDEGLIFNARRQELFGLTPAAAFLWCCLEEGWSIGVTIRTFTEEVGRDRTMAAAEVRGTLSQWYELGLLKCSRRSVESAPCPDPPVPPPPAADTSTCSVARCYRLLGTTFRVGYSDAKLTEWVDPVLNQFTVDSHEHDVLLNVVQARDDLVVSLEGREGGRCREPAELAPHVKQALLVAAINRHSFALYLHAAMLRVDGAALLLPAAPGSGKTCLAVALAQGGLAYHSDEVTLLEGRTFLARGVPTSPCIKAPAWPILEPICPTLSGLPAHTRTDGRVVKYMPAPIRPNDSTHERMWPVRWIVFPNYEGNAPTRLESLSRVQALRSLLIECLAMRLTLDSAIVEQLCSWIAGIDAYKLTFSSLDEAVEQIQVVCGRPFPQLRRGMTVS